MVYTTKFFKIKMFGRFIYNGTLWIRTGRNLYSDGTDGTNFAIPTLSTDVVRVVDKYYWTT